MIYTGFGRIGVSDYGLVNTKYQNNGFDYGGDKKTMDDRLEYFSMKAIQHKNIKNGSF